MLSAVVFHEPLFCQLGGMLGIIVLLEPMTIRKHALQKPQESFLSRVALECVNCFHDAGDELGPCSAGEVAVTLSEVVVAEIYYT